MEIIIILVLVAVGLALLIAYFDFVSWVGDFFSNYSVSFFVELFLLISPIVVVVYLLSKSG